MLLLGLDIGTSSIKASVVDAETQKVKVSASHPEKEAEIIAPYPGWAEQDPEVWWENAKIAIKKCHAQGQYDPGEIKAIGLSYQMHGLILVDKNKKVLRNAIIWCDSRATEIGSKAFQSIGEQKTLKTLLNAPGNFTASKLAWVKENEPDIYNKTDKILWPGDYITMKLTGTVDTTISALSEGTFWDFQKNEISEETLHYFGFEPSLIPAVQPLFSVHGTISRLVASELSLSPEIPVSYKAGDQPNNALALNVLNPGEVAATAGTSGVIYGISDKLSYDKKSRINSFAHVNYTEKKRRIGVLLCINGTGIFNRWIKEITGSNASYPHLNEVAAEVKPGAEGLLALPFGNGAERMLQNKIVGGHLLNLDFNIHTKAHIFRAVQEGIAFSFRYGLDIMRENGINPKVIKVSHSNLFLSKLFAQTFADVNKVTVELYEGDGSYGAAIGAEIGAEIFRESDLKTRTPVKKVDSQHPDLYLSLYEKWKKSLERFL